MLVSSRAVRQNLLVSTQCLQQPVPTPTADAMDRRTVFGGAAAAVTAAGTSSILPGAAVAAGGAPQVPTTKLGSLEVSQTIQGYWQLAGGHGPVRTDSLPDPCALLTFVWY